MTSQRHETDAMRRAIELSRRGPANGANPRVGCVILDAEGRVIAEGWHRGRGTAHAEVAALGALADRALAQGATAVVTLEPCNHTGATGPCSEALIDAGVGRVVYAVADPGASSSGGGERLRMAGVDVEEGVLGDEAEENIRPWLTSIRRGVPFVTVKWASSLDGRAAAADGSSRWITGPSSRADVHRRRAEAGAIVAGTGTVLADDPSLTARDSDGRELSEQPIAVIVGRRSVPRDSRVFAHPAGAIEYPSRDLSGLLTMLAERDVRHVFVEGGPTVASAFLAAGLADEVLVYLAPTVLGGPVTAITDVGVRTISEQARMRFDHIELLGDDVLLVARPLTTNDLPTKEDD
ncbi:bifunctional diaminohydroxyphosphoribosylaminopyrimidine deaminase/5-amino-6-(5-phosphoribosylamino)uracil reductase RibD [Agreia sp. VKM Ac-1783]|uniref:bifunctional diaminohydroxyphosphoribosylaminopyrimidine deaminase/5-amino-6-(5-phosphoribosylamino)uracil reductase RibD n=1 Tax=Agreia sp. VKM Ac-1783 TaxID=1938889 RepID=UPI000A2AD05F|nr:bifunctional diaminohydroxyphosphoribosylaminopyrimidine deaminase/5-amino-6-(5-phosphoribosylamino)uracil reductase RibD [Agreia sp. VKM Ac-1783]SMQ60103.1 diaminohydroxyphosphoribosylaminopyrimidine deaminase / 5-amino-6-(5-phosphoribosylamino)uracil reductase [Agreia sp. VKM Ac-1783]